MTERMAVEVVLFVDVPDDITSEQMDRKAEAMVQGIADDTGYGYAEPTCWLVSR